MKAVAKMTAFMLICALTSTASAAVPKADDLNQLLQQIRDSAAQNSALDRQREQQFLQQSDRQSQILAAARQALAAEQTRNNQLQSSFDANKKVLDGLLDQLRAREGDFGRVFDTVRQTARDLKSTLDNSLVSAQYQGRGVFLARLAESRDLPSLDNLRKLWFLMQQEMTESGMVRKFPASVTREDGTQTHTSVVRIGVFNAISGDNYLQYFPETGALVELNRQPDGSIRSQAETFYNARSGVLPMPIDPTGGSLLAALVNQPSFMERISQAHTAGWLIMILGVIGLFIVIERAIYLTLIGRRIKAQMSSSKPDFNNPLGRILTAFNEARNDDVQTLELRMDEAFMKERPMIEARLGFLKIISLVAVLLGLLGTVAGVMNTFQAINLLGNSMPLVADGIAAALVSTWLGLLVAVTLLFCHGLLTTRGEALMQRLEQQVAGIIAVRSRKINPAKAVR
jgi:biopolymer transport protein ExbB